MAIGSLSADLDSIIDHVGVTVVIGGVTGRGVPRREQVSILGESGHVEVAGHHTVLTVRDGVFSGLAQDVAVTVDGASYLIRHPGTKLTDGTRKLVLVEATP